MREITIPSRTVFEDIKSFEHQIGIFVDVLVGICDETGHFEPQVFDRILIQDIPERRNRITNELLTPAITDYTDLLSANPDWAPNKPAGTFRKEDLWVFIDRIRARR